MGVVFRVNKSIYQGVINPQQDALLSGRPGNMQKVKRIELTCWLHTAWDLWRASFWGFIDVHPKLMWPGMSPKSNGDQINKFQIPRRWCPRAKLLTIPFYNSVNYGITMATMVEISYLYIPWRIHGAGVYMLTLGGILMGSMAHHI